MITCQAIECSGVACNPPKPMFCMDVVGAKNYGKNIVNTEAYINELVNLLKTVVKPVQ